MRDEKEKAQLEIKEASELIVKKTYELDVFERYLKDKNLVKNKQSELRLLSSEHNLVKIDVDVATSKIKDLKNQQEITNKQIEDLLTEKRAIDKSNDELELKLQGRGKSEDDQKKKIFEGEKEQTLKLTNHLEFYKEDQEKMNAQLTSEEAKAKHELDQKITAEQAMEDESEFFEKEAKLREKNREELIKLQLKLSLLKSSDDKVTEELREHKEQNAALKKENEDLDKFNTKEEEDISLVIQRIQISALLKEIDVEEMKGLAEQNTNMN